MSFGLKILIFNSGRLQISRYISLVATYPVVQASLISKFAIDDIPNHCYADYKSSIIINYNGDIFKCTARSFNHHERIGILENDGNITETERAKLYNINRFRPQCRSCKLLPICVICIQKKIENNTCEIKKEDIDCQLRMKLMAVIEKYI